MTSSACVKKYKKKTQKGLKCTICIFFLAICFIGMCCTIPLEHGVEPAITKSTWKLVTYFKMALVGFIVKVKIKNSNNINNSKRDLLLST